MSGFLSSLALEAAPSFLSGVASLFGANRSDKRQAAENQKNREWNLMLAEKQNAWNLEQWNRENEYNAPVNQVKRLRDAGLNPSLVGGASSGNSGSITMTAGAPSTPTDYSQGAAMRLNAMSQFADIGLKAAQAKLLRSEAEGKDKDNKNKDLDLRLRDNLSKLFVDGETLDLILDGSASGLYDYETMNKLLDLSSKFQSRLESRSRLHHQSYENRKARIQAELSERSAEHELSIIASNAKISLSEARNIVTAIQLRNEGYRLDNSMKQHEQDLRGVDFIKDAPDWLKALYGLLLKLCE